MCIACDHRTPVAVRTHTTEPIPFCFLDSKNILSGTHDGFNEVTATASGLHIPSGHALIPYLVQRMQEVSAA